MNKLMPTLFLVAIVLIPSFALALGPTDTTVDTGNGSTNYGYKIEIPSPLNPSINSIPTLIQVIIDDLVIPIGAVVAVLMIMYAGFLFVTSQGNTSKVGEAKNALINASIGVAILLGAKVLAEAIQLTISKLG